MALARDAGAGQEQRDAADQNFDYMFKLLIIGNSSVGKTSFLFRFADDSFTSAFVSTVGIDFKVKTIYRNDKRVKLQIWDTAGQERYRTITTAYYRGAMGFLLMYDITSQETFYAVQDWATQIKTYSWGNAQVVLLGNKLDLEEDRQVPTEDAQRLATELGFEFFETSAKDNINVKQVFEKLVDVICEKMNESVNGDAGPFANHKEAGLKETPRSSTDLSGQTDRTAQCERKENAKMCCSGFLKIMMFVFNGGIFLAGAVILGVGVWVKVDSGSLLGILDTLEDAPSGLSQLVNVSYLLMAVGAVLLVIGFLGCCGAVRESRCMLLTFFSIVLIIFLVEVAGAVVLLVFQGLADQLFQSLEKEVKISIGKEYGRSDSFTSLWNATMEEFKCCGFKNYTDFDGSPFYNDHGRDVYPHTCCNTTITTGVCNTHQANHSMIDGCFDKLLQLIEDNALIIAIVVLAIAAFEIAAMVVSMVLYKQIGKKA
ncbi:hypothetical protein EPR50_G00015950 [Perca flavescens]|uniref:small monomeric GTPase n=2 Tax=Perca flavescens TaxID=8167 RepID=A0A484DLC8_PERFV|nr:hypothetical protein EPR50_G00015950 [Perca flavescens]